MTTKRRAWFILILILTAIAIYASIVLYWQRHFDIKLSSWTGKNQAQLAQINENLERTLNGMKKGEIPWRKADYKSIGFPEKEAKLLELRWAIEAYSVSFGRLPSKLQQLPELFSISPVSRRTRGHYENLTRGCSLLILDENSYVLNCDEWDIPSKTELDRLLSGFSPETEKFYSVGKHVVLFVPPFVKGRPLTLEQQPAL